MYPHASTIPKTLNLNESLSREHHPQVTYPFNPIQQKLPQELKDKPSECVITKLCNTVTPKNVFTMTQSCSCHQISQSKSFYIPNKKELASHKEDFDNKLSTVINRILPR